MSVRVSESWTSRNGRRYTVSTGAGTYLLGLGVQALIVLPVVAAWLLFLLTAEVILLAVTGTQLLAAVLRGEARIGDVCWIELPHGLFMIGMKGARR
jgi:hypothetical protein